MKHRIVGVTAAALVIGGIAGCSSPPPIKAKRGTLPPGTAQLSVSDADAGSTQAVRCTDIAWSTIITTGDDRSGTTVMVSSEKKLSVESVQIRNINGFTGNYNVGLEGNASVALTDATYHITGSALGYEPTSIAPTTRPFAIKVAC